MKYVTEYRDGAQAQRLLAEIAKQVTRPWTLMEVCGGQTHAIIRYGIDQLLPPGVELLHGPGCPVCVTSVQTIDQAVDLALHPRVIVCSFGDMLRVPGSHHDLMRARASGGDVRVVYSPLDAVQIARDNPDFDVVFLAIGFETTAPANALAVKLAKQQRVRNFSMLVAQVLVPPAIEAIMNSPGNRVQAFLAAGHVCCVTGLSSYERICERYRVPIVVTGFEPLDVLDGIRRAIVQLEQGEADVENAYARVVLPGGNAAAQQVIEEVFEVTDQWWRGLGRISGSGWRLTSAFKDFDAVRKFDLSDKPEHDLPLCRSGEVLKGTLKPTECEAFGKYCTPDSPLGATMVSSEGACAAYYHYRHL